MPDALHCRLISPDECLLDQPACFASIPAWDGSIGVYPLHAPLLTRLGMGELRIDLADTDTTRGGSRSYLVSSGFVQVMNDSLTILAELAIPAERLSESEAQAELRESEARRPADAADVRELERIQAAQRLAAKKLELARKWKGRGI